MDLSRHAAKADPPVAFRLKLSEKRGLSVRCLKAALFARLLAIKEARLGAAISEPYQDEPPNRSEARTTKPILIEPPTCCKFQVGRRDKSLFCSGFSVVGAGVSFVYAAVAGAARPTALTSAACWAGDDVTGKPRTTIVKPPRGKEPTSRPKTVAVTESVK
jgi:hypothetical protein